MFYRILALIILFVTASVAAAQTATTGVTIIVLDTSGSMKGPRIDSAKQEILAVGKQSPPTKERPFILVPFAGAPHHVATVTDFASLEANLKKIEAVGSTNIASALNAGLEQLKPYARAGHLCFLFYSDGEDTDSGPEAIAEAEKKLDTMFADRSQQGLSNLLFCKRWDNAQARLLANLAKQGHTKVIDAQDLKVVPVTLTPIVKVLRATWAKISRSPSRSRSRPAWNLRGSPSIPTFPPQP